MEKIIGIIKDIKPLKETEKYLLSLVTIDDVGLTTFDKAISQHFKIGDEVEAEYEVTEKGEGKIYRTIQHIKIYNKESAEVYEKVINSLEKPVEQQSLDMIKKDIFTSEIELGGKVYTITIKPKDL